jgi:hypothetical protein
MENRYNQLIEKIFFLKYREGSKIVEFIRSDIENAAKTLHLKLPKNLGDVIYSFRFRNELPAKITDLATHNEEWIIKLAGRSTYCFSLEQKLDIKPNLNLVHTKILDSTPGVINKYSLTDEQSLLAILRYNRLIDIFLGLTCYSLQNHLRTTVPGLGQVETDEIYIGLDKKGIHYIIPVQAKGGNDRQGKVQILQDIDLCKNKFPNLVCIPVAAQFMNDKKIALFSFEQELTLIKIASERHYKLVHDEELTDVEIQTYRSRT